MKTKKKYKIKITPKLLKILKKHWARFQKKEEWFWGEVCTLEKDMALETKIEDIEFIHTDTGWCGIGNESRTIPLIQQDKLEKV